MEDVVCDTMCEGPFEACTINVGCCDAGGAKCAC